ncbi:MAG: cell envelope biogenesis protein TolA [Sphingomonadales bacterium]|nr:cell envelope biogenesis protein TolA [Sphingomonadales bacterium]PIX67723.1 MAG: cell envelope biogenesis protein TolA [Sphingomonadales bacterium CG_4_10_14_3_um_filter_58_15]NCO49522.1 cell envelope biogenesis protein TolA [Sphingomonadales bacterium]NCP01115.1 cell envelope biogenesis protein TolA [Sphingomonadales bacterium]NCP25497.1 cell envelope biogenesis protein TolA [Sphingomonadales bacterium]
MEKAEKIGLGIAAAGHLALFGALSFSILSSTNEAFRNKPIEVMIADEVGLESAAPNPALVPPATSVAPELGAPEESSFVEPEPLPEPPKAEAKPKPSATPAPVSREPRRRPDKPASVAAKAEPKPKPKPRGSRLGDDFLKGVTDAPSVSRNQNITAEKASPAAVASLERELYRLVKQKWRPPTGADAELLRTTVTARLDSSGRIIGRPTATTTGITPSNRSQVEIHQERAIAAVQLAAPFTTFPEKFYDEWKVIEPVLYLGV